MATVRFEDPTPCPPPRQGSRASLAAGPPRHSNRLISARPRRPRPSRQSIGWDPTIDICEDTFEFSKQPVSQPSRPSLGPPARRLSVTSETAAVKPEADTKRRRLSTRPSPIDEDLPPDEPTIALKNLPRDCELRREPRRRTIYVPSDDTTIFTIHPGASLRQGAAQPRKPRRSDIFIDATEDEAQNEERAAEDHNRPRPARKSLMAAPRRGPLQHSSRPLNILPSIADVPGSADGKENIPPGTGQGDMFEKSKAAGSPVHIHNNGSRQSISQRVHHQSVTTDPPAIRPSAFNESSRSPILAKEASKPFNGKLQMLANRASLAPARFASSRNLPGASVMSVSQTSTQRRDPHPVIPEQILAPELYEDNWLGQQEIAMSELINDVFGEIDAAKSRESSIDGFQRQRLLDIYHEPSLLLLHKRLQASLRFGALSISHDTAIQVARFKDDLGQRQRFIDLWTKTYNGESLQVALEAVVGRRLSTASKESDGGTAGSSSEPPEAKAKCLSTFLKKFLVQNEDAPNNDTCSISRRSTLVSNTSNNNMDVGSLTWMWRRTVLRSLMVVLLLDKGQAAGIFQGCLFQPNSPFKSSAAVLHALAMLLVPSVGDIVRTLGHLNFHVSHVQYPLQEKEYRIKNLATDLRDGILLTRLVETLLYPPAALNLHLGDFSLTLPSGDTLISTIDTTSGQGWVLSQHLKYPCTGRAQQLYNVQIALCALANFRDVGRLVEGISADDIVDGHREKSVRLLWALVGRWGLPRLLDMEHLADEVRRLERRWGSRSAAPEGAGRDDIDEVEADLSLVDGAERSKILLKFWARNAARLHGVHVDNLSTSFADREAFRAIVNEYACALPSRSVANPALLASTAGAESAGSPRPDGSLTRTLRRMGCSRAFIALFQNTSSIPTAQTTVPLLAFLASRLLPACRPYFAAVAIQQAWRRHTSKVLLSKRLALARLARDCAVVVRTRERIVAAAVTIQKWWRAVSFS